MVTRSKMDSEWPDKATCKGREDDMFVQGAQQNIAKKICRPCPVRLECLAYSLDYECERGVWGGMTERERRALLRRHPNVSSWWKLFEKSKQQEGK